MKLFLCLEGTHQTPGIEIQDFSFEENSTLFEKLVNGFGKLFVVTMSSFMIHTIALSGINTGHMSRARRDVARVIMGN